MKKKIASFLVLASILSLGSLASCGGDTSSTSGEGEETEIVIRQDENKYVDTTLEEFLETPYEDYQKREDNGEVAYFFEGQYTEGFGTILDPCYLDLYLCNDGMFYGSNTGLGTSVGVGEQIYGYWYNVNSDGEDQFMMHVTGYVVWGQQKTFPDSQADIICFPESNHGSYTYSAGVAFPLYGGAMSRTINIYGMPYTAAKSLTADTTNIKEFHVGDRLSQFALDDSFGVTFKCVRGDGTEETIHNERVHYSGFDSTKEGKQTVTAEFLSAKTTFEVNVLPAPEPEPEPEPEPSENTFPEGEIEYTDFATAFANASDHPDQYTITNAEDNKSCDISYEKPEAWSNVVATIPEEMQSGYNVFSIDIENKGTTDLSARLDLNGTTNNAARQDGSAIACTSNQVSFTVEAGVESTLEFYYEGNFTDFLIFLDSMVFFGDTGTNELHLSNYQLGVLTPSEAE